MTAFVHHSGDVPLWAPVLVLAALALLALIACVGSVRDPARRDLHDLRRAERTRKKAQR